MKSFFYLILIFSALSLNAQTPELKNEKKYTAGVSIAPLELTYWLWGNLSVNKEYAETPQHTYFKTLYPSGLYLNVELNSLFKLNTGFSYNIEKFDYGALTNERGYLLINYKVQYLSIPLAVNYYPWHNSNKKAIGGFFIQPAINFDFLMLEHIKTEVSAFRDCTHSSNPDSCVYPAPTLEETNSSKFRFNRISPSLAMGREIVGDRLSFWYNGKCTFPSVYQVHNTQEYFKNLRFGINIGFGYRF